MIRWQLNYHLTKRLLVVGLLATVLILTTCARAQVKIAFVSHRDGNAEVYVMDADGSNPTNLTNDSALDSFPVWSPDGSKIAFVSFRDGTAEIYVMGADGSKCAITECDAEEALEAAHILPYLGPATNHPSNGLLLWADIHLLFDLGLVAIDTQTMTVIIHSRLRNTTYQALAGKQLRLPKSPSQSPSKDALDSQRNDSGL